MSVTLERAPAVPRRSADRRMLRRALAFIAPAVILLLAIYILPLGFLAGFSLTDYQLGATGAHFTGFANFLRAFHDPVFLRALGNTVIYSVIVIPLGVGLGLGAALLIHGRKRTRAVWEVAYFLPVTATLVAMATVWKFVLHPTLGPVGQATEALGLGQPAFLSDPHLMMPTMAMIGIWQVLGFNMVLFLAGLSAIPKDLIEAARLDGAKSAIDRFLMVTWPILGPTTLFVTVTTSITAFKVFETVAVLTQGRNGSETVLYALYLEGFEYFDTGYASALTLIFLGIMLLLSIGQTFQLDRKVHY